MYKVSENTRTKAAMASSFAMLVLIGFEAGAVEDGNPLVKHIYTADPSAHVFEDRVYIYASHDKDDATRYDMEDYHVLSSEDLVNWEDHGVVLSLDDVAWTDNRMWAPDCVFKDGTYYFYFPARDKTNTFRIGVATSDSPAGPFIPEPDFIKGTDEIDPAVFIDDDGQAYMYWGGKSVSVAKLDETMKQFGGDAVKLEGVDYFYEAAWMHKRGGTYYLSYSTGKFHPDTDDHIIAYATSDSPMGPFSYQGIVSGDVSGITNHHSTVEYKGQWYLFYHNSDLSGGNNTRRSVVADYLHFNDDGSIRQVIQTDLGIGQYNGLATIEAENFSETRNAKKRENSDEGLHVVFDSNDKIVFNNVDFGDQSISRIHLNLASDSSTGKIMLRTKTGNLLATIAIPEMGGADKWQTISAETSPLTGLNDISLTYTNTDLQELRLDSVVFSRGE